KFGLTSLQRNAHDSTIAGNFSLYDLTPLTGRPKRQISTSSHFIVRVVCEHVCAFVVHACQRDVFTGNIVEIFFTLQPSELSIVRTNHARVCCSTLTKVEISIVDNGTVSMVISNTRKIRNKRSY